jgi:transposase-like protein
MIKATRARYTLEFKQEAVRLVESGQSIAAASRTLGLVEQTLFFWFCRIPFRSKDTIVQVRFGEERFHTMCNVTTMDGLLQ